MLYHTADIINSERCPTRRKYPCCQAWDTVAGLQVHLSRPYEDCNGEWFWGRESKPGATFRIALDDLRHLCAKKVS